MTKYFTKEQIMKVMEEQNLMLDDIWGVEQRLDELPVADVVEVVHGTWIFDDFDDHSYAYCSQCGEEQDAPEYVTSYCPFCGALMDGGGDYDR